ncbi:phosphatase PAP2 family protein [Mesorhizobium sp. YC-39]|uniref:phosphatase PAP2 family protein n=1 Tax=unclassified Mesorhizobium TaxID=325217 RepID=UPI0021E868E4|nr:MULTISPECIES: phosphatase PAP2 family protein [unclassified Mesorhizobium]MCV3208398.1 phosphatase PAP2 family protein [Mesorhizobium sp. YC-2]MCV3232252.1 phosphatase PAP2 family protein [Mesorhizobium sp. YC-39]
MIFLPAERTILTITLAMVAVCLFLIWEKGVVVALGAYGFSIGFAVVMIALGQFYRHFRKVERIALTTHILALFIVYSVPTSLFNLLLLPRPSAPIDATLVQMDAWLGYSWPDACAWISQYPRLSDILRQIYNLTLAQILFVFLFLGMANDRRRLHAAALGTVFASLATIFCWALFPSSGASAYWTLAPEIDRIVRPVVNSAYGAELNRLLVEGVRDISTLKATGLVGFPSFHTVMALMSLTAVWPYRPMRFALILINAALLPAILIHGGHNLMDVLGGTVVTALCWRLGLVAFEAQQRRPSSGPRHAQAVVEA